MNNEGKNIVELLPIHFWQPAVNDGIPLFFHAFRRLEWTSAFRTYRFASQAVLSSVHPFQIELGERCMSEWTCNLTTRLCCAIPECSAP